MNMENRKKLLKLYEREKETSIYLQRLNLICDDYEKSIKIRKEQDKHYKIQKILEKMVYNND